MGGHRLKGSRLGSVTGNCSVIGCERVAAQRARIRGTDVLRIFCTMHAQRAAHTPANVDIPAPLRAPNGAGCCVSSKQGYRVITLKDGRRMGEHRAVMEGVLGRRLLRDEHVHHLNGNGLDNTPGNLRILSNHDHKLLHYALKRDYHDTSLESLIRLHDTLSDLIHRLSWPAMLK